MSTRTEDIIQDYRDNYESYQKLEEIVVALIEEEIKESGLMVFQVMHRLKKEDSLRGKLEKWGDYYQERLDLMDLLGVRVITYFQDDVDVIAERIEKLFVIDRENSTDKRKLIEADRFGYLSLHYICSLKPEQTEDPELAKIRFEIQLRSVLQHAWAEINHDIGYKNENGLPRELTRELSRIAGLLEIADNHFSGVRESVREYQNEAEINVRSRRFEELPVNEMTLKAYFEIDEWVKNAFGNVGITLVPKGCEDSVERLEALGIRTMGEFDELVKKNLDKALELAAFENGGEKPETISCGLLVRFLVDVYLAQNQEEVSSYLKEYYGLGSLADRRRKELEKVVRRMRKGSATHRQGPYSTRSSAPR